MRYRILAVVPAWLMVVAAAHAMPQSTPRPSDSWAVPPAASSSVGYRSGSPTATPDKSPFKFKDRHLHGQQEPPPPGAADKAAVMGTERAWQNGRPPADCAQTPMDAGCH
ncbi:MAG TPA: hypothetical protein VIM06_01295 [Rhodanobacter sp.]